MKYLNYIFSNFARRYPAANKVQIELSFIYMCSMFDIYIEKEKEYLYLRVYFVFDVWHNPHVEITLSCRFPYFLRILPQIIPFGFCTFWWQQGKAFKCAKSNF